MTALTTVEDVHFWEQGPQDVERLTRPIYANKRRHDWRFRFYIEKIEGSSLSRAEALRRIGAVLHHAQGWERTGVRWARTMDPSLANIRLSIVRDGESVCGSSAGGCYSWGGTDTPLAEVNVSYLDDADQTAFRIVLGMELCGHGTFRMLDMYSAPHNPPGDPYHGSMGTWREAVVNAGWPVEVEIAAAKRWLGGETSSSAIHDD